MAPDICPNCGAIVADERAAACPECGADENTGWNDQATSQRLDLPDDEFDYDDYLEKEFGTSKSNPLKVEGVSWATWIVAIVVLLLLLGYFF
jgi:hypothetical protein